MYGFGCKRALYEKFSTINILNSNNSNFQIDLLSMLLTKPWESYFNDLLSNLINSNPEEPDIEHFDQ